MNRFSDGFIPFFVSYSLAYVLFMKCLPERVFDNMTFKSLKYNTLSY